MESTNKQQYNIAQNKSFAQKGVGTYMATMPTYTIVLLFATIRLVVVVSSYSIILYHFLQSIFY